MKEYLDILRDVYENGIRKPNRTGIETISKYGEIFRFDMSTGKFPLLTTKKMSPKSIFAELEMFIKGAHSKKFLHERNCTIWDEWCDPTEVPYGHDLESRLAMKECDELGPIYGVQWRNWNYQGDGHGGFDQLRWAISTLKTDPTCRRLVVSAWNPDQMKRMALPPCHYAFQLDSDGTTLNLGWNQRSVDCFLGLPYNIAEYAMLLLLICKETGLKPGTLVGFLGDCHIYENQMFSVREQLHRTPTELPTLEVTSDIQFPIWMVTDWKYTDYTITGYNPQPAIKAPVAV